MKLSRQLLPLCAALLCTACGGISTSGNGYTRFVDPHIGTGEHGHVFMGANVPFGMVQLGPTSLPQSWDWTSGYHESDSTVIGFSHTHLSGTGIGDPHIGVEMIWPMSIMMRAFTATDDDEIRDCICQLITTDAGTGFMHESFSPHSPAGFTRPLFAWQNTLFGELIIKPVNDGKTDLLNSIN